MGERWFETPVLEEMATPTMDRAIAAIDGGDVAEARRLCEEMKSEWVMLHDLMVESVAGLISFVQEEMGDEGVPAAWRYTFDRVWKHHHDAVGNLDRKKVVTLLARTWRAHSASGAGPEPGGFRIIEDDEKFTFVLDPCGSGQRLVRRGTYEGELSYGTADEVHGWTYGREDFPLYCTHCAFMNEQLPLEWGGLPMYPTEPPEDYATQPCRWYWYKDPADIPAHFREPRDP